MIKLTSSIMKIPFQVLYEENVTQEYQDFMWHVSVDMIVIAKV